MSNVRDEVVKELGSMPTPILSDVMGQFGSMDYEIKSVIPNARIYGRAVTARTSGGAWLSSVRAIQVAKAGDVIVVDGGGLKNVGCFGGQVCTDLKRKGAVGAVVDGAVRDIDEIRRLNFPVFARAIVPCVGSDGPAGDVNNSIQCGGQKVSPGDIIVGDNDGVMVVPKEKAEQVLIAARKRHARETELMEEAERTGKLIVDIGNFTQAWHEKRKKSESAGRVLGGEP